MIPNQWYVLLESAEVKLHRPLGVTRFGEKLVFWRDAQGQVTCMRDVCPHRGVALHLSKLRGGCIECPFHGFQFDARGHCTLIPANGRASVPPKAMHVPTYPAREAHGFIYVWYGEPQAEYPPLPFFDSIDETFSFRTLRDHWATHYSRAIENQLDVVHLPFVHASTIGRGNKTVVNGPLSHIVPASGGECLELWVSNVADTGQLPVKARDLPAPLRRPFLQFLFPNLWHNWIGDQVHVVIAFVPIDDENTMMYLRYYQNMMRLPLVRELFNLLGTAANLVIERQDKRVVITQVPKRADLHIGETLIPGDAPIIQYRRHRRELIERAAQNISREMHNALSTAQKN